MTGPARTSTTLGIHLKICGALCMTLMAACVKALEGTVPLGQIAFYRSVVTLLPIFAWILWEGRAAEVFRMRHLARHFPRGVFGSIAMILSFVALACLPLADAILLGYTTPLMTVILAIVMLKERVPGYRWAAALLGTAGVVIALSPHLASTQRASYFSPAAMLGIAAGLGAALFGAISIVQIRSLAKTEPAGAVAFYYTFMTGVLGLASIAFGWVMPDAKQLALLLGAGLFGGVAQFLVAESLRHARVSVTAPFEYTTLLWSSVISYAVFDQKPGAALFTGGALVAASGVFTVWRESAWRQPGRLGSRFFL
jgi:drug/metabolite transporter (DMT)-like permease